MHTASPSIRTGWWPALALAGLATACAVSLPSLRGAPGNGPPAGSLTSYHGTLQPSCSPVDAPALLLELEADAPQGPTQISVLLWPPGDLQAGTSIRLGDSSNLTAAAIWAGDTEWHLAADGRLWVEAYLPRQQVSGQFRLEFEGGRQLEGQFQASWLESGPLLCG